MESDNIQPFEIDFTKQNSLGFHPACCMYHYSLFLLNRIPLYGCVGLFNHSPVERHLGCFQVLFY